MNISSKIIILGILAGFYFLTLAFAAKFDQRQSLSAVIHSSSDSPILSPKNQTSVSMSPKSMVTNPNVTNVTMMSPIITKEITPGPIIKTPNITLSPTMVPMVTAIARVTPTLTPIARTSEPIVSPTAQSVPTSVPAQSSVNVVINEIAWMGTAASPDDEWIELYNPGSMAIDLTGWRLKAKDGTPNITLADSLGPNSYYLLERTSDDTVNDVAAGAIYTGALGNSGEYLELFDSQGDLVDSLDASKGWPAGANPSGNPTGRASMERVDPARSGDDPTNWKTNDKAKINGLDSKENPINGTPGQANSVQI